MTETSPPAPRTYGEADRLARGAGVTFLGHAAGRALGFVLTLVLTRWLGASDFGSFILALTIFQCAGLLADLGLRYGALRFVAMAEGREDHREVRRIVATVIRYSLVASLGGMVVLGAASPLLADWFRQPVYRWLIPVIALALPFSTVGAVVKSILQALRRLTAVALLQHVLDPLVRIGVFVALAGLGWGIAAAVASHLAAVVVVFGAALAWLLPHVPPGWGGRARVREKEILAFSVPLSLAHAAALAMQWADSLFLGYFTTSRDVGIYGAASRMAALGGMTLFAASMSFGPYANELYGRDDLAGLRRLYQQVTRWLIMVTLPILVLIVTYAPWLLHLFGAEFLAGGPVLLILACATFVTVATGPAGDVALIAGRSNTLLLAGALLTVFDIGMLWLLVPRWGVVGAAIATGATTAVSNVTNVLLGWWFLALQPYSPTLMRPVVIGGCAALLTALNTPGSARMTASTPASASS